MHRLFHIQLILQAGVDRRVSAFRGFAETGLACLPRILSPAIVLGMALSLFLAGCAAVNPQKGSINAGVIHRYFAEWANGGDVSVADALLTPDLVFHSAKVVLQGREEYKTRLLAFHHAFPDLRYQIEDEVYGVDKAVVRWSLKATQAIEYQGHSPNGKTMTVTGMSIFRLKDGKIHEIWVNMDRLGQMEQLGWLPEARRQSK